MRVANSIAELIGQTPIVKLNTFTGPEDAEVYIKLESFNPGGSVKDRIAYSMIIEAEKEGKIKPGDTLVEPTSGNTGIGLAMMAAAKGYKVVIVMPETMSIERRNLLRAYGAELVLTPGAEGMKGAIAKANALLQENPTWFMPQQFDNPANPKIHRETTAAEILAAIPDLDAFVAGVGTGGTITGV
ncbi:MAG: PLP-dependent cysteine synthase family protein, partial [Tumebacillaceae bacterium]